MTVRRTREEDWADLRALRLAMLLDTPLAFGSTYARERDYPESLWRERAAGTTWVAHEAGATGDVLPMGLVTLWHAPDQAPDESWLVGMWVAPHARGRGVADELVGALLEHARRAGLQRVLLEVAEANARAARAYSRLGFEPTGESGASRTHPHICEITMAHRLSPPAI